MNDSTLTVSLMSFCNYVPYVIVSLFAGAFIDRHSKKELCYYPTLFLLFVQWSFYPYVSQEIYALNIISKRKWHEFFLLISEALFLPSYLMHNRGLLMVVFTMALLNFFSRLTYENLLTPMILSRSGNDSMALGVVNAVLGIGCIVGGMIVSAGKLSKNNIMLSSFIYAKRSVGFPTLLLLLVD